jgi:hypothetical protein
MLLPLSSTFATMTRNVITKLKRYDYFCTVGTEPKSMKMKNSNVLLLVFFLLTGHSYAQTYSDMVVGKKNETEADSLKNADYPYSLPIWGKEATQKGFNLPYSAGISTQYVWQKSELVIDNLSVGFNNQPMRNLDEIIRFEKAISEASVVNLRPDIWLFPFLNVYGIFAYSQPSTTVDFGLWIPDSTGTSKEIYSYSTKASFNARSIGFGLTPTIGVGGGFMALDMNMAWTDVDALDKPVFTYIFGPRLGKTFKLKKPERTVAFWAGGFRVKYSSETSGSLALSELIEDDAAESSKIDNAQQKVNDSQQQVNEWWNGLTAAQQNNPVNKAKYEAANSALDAAGNILSAASEAVNTISNSTVQYSLDKRVKDMWNFVLGAQFQYNKHWQLRAEYGFLGSRQQFVGGLQYRFGL